MNYLKHYNLLIERSKNRILAKIYMEKHHIIPKCLGGTDAKENIALLTPEEHYLAHLLLVKIYPKFTPLVSAAIMMTTHNTTHRMNNKLYGWLRRRASVARKHHISEYGHPKGMLGKKHTDESNKKRADSCKKAMTESVGVKVYAYNLDGSFFKEYSSITECAVDLKTNPSNVKYTAEGKFGHCKNKQIRYTFIESITPYIKPSPLKGKVRSKEHQINLNKSIRESRSTCTYCGFESKSSAITRYHNQNCKYKETPNPKVNKVKKTNLKTKGISKPITICPHCNKEGAGPVMQRFHFNNCKEK
jgi:hypothetical protein